MKYLIDSDWIIDGIAGVGVDNQTIAALSPDGVGVSVVTLGEVFEGAFDTPDPRAKLALFRAYLADFPVLPLDDPTMETFARLRSTLRAQGNLIPDLDLQIAATAVTLDLTLVTRNTRHFARIPGLSLHQPPPKT